MSCSPCPWFLIPVLSSPATDITPDSQVQEGSAFAIKCSLTKSSAVWKGSTHYFNSSNIIFHFHDTVVDQSRVTTRDENSAELLLDPAKLTDSGLYYCYVATPDDTALVCSMQLEVGSPPSRIGQENMSCLSEEYESLTCSWQTPDFHTKTTWTLREYLGANRAAECPIVLSENSCRWTTHTHPAYRKHVQKIKLALTIANRYGNLTEMFTINHYEIIRPGKPVDVSIADVRSTSVELSWKMQHGFDFGGVREDDNSVPKLLYQVQVIPLSRRDELRNLTTTSLGMNVTSLTPHTTYMFKIRCKTTEAKGDHMWSDAVPVSMETKADGKLNYFCMLFRSPLLWLHPCSQCHCQFAPRISLSFSASIALFRFLIMFPFLPTVPSKIPLFRQTFESIKMKEQERSIVVFWDPLEERDANGPSFHYVITAAPTITRNRFQRSPATSIGNVEEVVTIKSINQSSYTFVALSSSTAYLFRIHSANAIGQSLESSTLHVDKEVSLTVKPATVEAYNYDDGRYEVRWSYPSDLSAITGTTISWCPVNNTKSALMDNCSGPLQTAVVQRPMQKAHTITVSEDSVYQFGVSANYKDNQSSPITWASCVVPISIKKLDKIHKFAVRAINATAVRVSWKLPCDGLQAVVSKFEVLHCRISFNNNSCSEFVSNDVVGGASEFLTVGALDPLTAYRFVVRAWTESAAGVDSDPIDETTFGTEVSIWIMFFYLLSLLCLVLVIAAILLSLAKWYRRIAKNMKAPIVLPGRLAGEKIDFSVDHSHVIPEKRRTRDSTGNLLNGNHGFYTHHDSAASSYDDLVYPDVNQIPGEAVAVSGVLCMAGASDDLKSCERTNSIGLSSFGFFPSDQHSRGRGTGRPVHPEVEELCPGNCSDTTVGSQDSGLEVKNMSARSRRKKMMRKEPRATVSSTETSAGAAGLDQDRRSHQQETSFNVEEGGISDRLSPSSSKNELANKSINHEDRCAGIPLVNGYVTHEVISKLQQERKRLPSPASPIFVTSVSLEEEDSAFISDSTTRSSSTDSGDSAAEQLPASAFSPHSQIFVKNSSGYVSVPVPHPAASPVYFT